MYLEGIVLSEISQKKTNTVQSHFYVKSKNIKHREPGAQGCGKWGDVWSPMLSKSINFQR